MSVQTCTAAIVKALTTAEAPAYDWGDALKRANFPEAYSVVHVSERVPEVLRLDGTTDARSYRAVVKCHGRDFNGLLNHLETVRGALLWQQIDLPDGRWFAPAPSIDPDPVDRENSWFTAVREFVFVV